MILVKSDEQAFEGVHGCLSDSYENVYRLMEGSDKRFYLERLSDLKYSNSTPPMYVFSREKIE